MKNKLKQKNIPARWKQIKLGEISDINMGQSPSSLSYNSLSDGTPLIQGNNDIKNNLTVGRIWTTEITKTAEKGDIILSVRAPVGSVAIAHRKVCIGRGVCAIKSQHKDFIWHYLKYFELKWKALEQGSTFTAVNGSDIRNIKLNIPIKTEEEKDIVKVLEIWDLAIEKLGEKIEVKKRIKKGLMQELLTGKTRLPGFSGEWEIVKIGAVGEIVSGGTPNTNKKEYWNGDVPWVTPTEITALKGKYLVATRKKITRLGLKNCSAFLIPANSLILCSRATVGDCVINIKEITTNQGFKNIIPRKINIEFLYYLILTKKHYLKRISSGSTFLEFSKKDLSKMKINIPAPDEQTAIANILAMVDKEILGLDRKLAILKEQKRFLLNNLVTGAIRVPGSIK